MFFTAGRQALYDANPAGSYSATYLVVAGGGDVAVVLVSPEGYPATRNGGVGVVESIEDTWPCQ